jgi:hypothetical protein
MVIGSVLLQPARIDPKLAWDSALLDDALTLGARLAWDQTHGGEALQQITAAGLTVFTGIFQHAARGRDTALAKFQKLFAPILDRLSAAVGKLPGEADPHELLVGGEQLFGLLAEAAQSLTVNQLRDYLDQALTIVTQDLGLTNKYVQSQVAALFDKAVEQLRSAPAPTDAAARANRREIAALLRRIQREIESRFVIPELNADRLAGTLVALLRKGNFDGDKRRVALAGTAAKDALAVGVSVSDLVPFSLGFGGGGPGAAEAATAAKVKKLWYASWLAGENIRGTDNTSTPPLNKYTFGAVNANAMETLTYVCNFVVVSANIISTLILSSHKGQIVNTLLQVVYWATGIVLAARLDYDIENLPWYINPLATTAFIALVANFEGRWFGAGDGALYFFRLFYNVLGVLGHLPFNRLRDAVIAVITHANYQGSTQEPFPGDADTRPLNRNKFDGLTIFLMGTAGAAIHFALMPHNFFSVGFGEKNSFGDTRHPFGTFFSAFVFGGLGLSIVYFFTFGTLSACLPPLWPDGLEAFKVFWKGFLAELSGAFGFFYTFNDGKTDDGKRGYLPDDGRGTETAFPGYPDRTVTPYRLPFTGSDQQCIQGNHGIWSHNSTRDVPLDFAYDFSMSRGTEVLAMRSGKVFAVVDNIGDGDNLDGQPDGNRIVIQHAAEDRAYDRDDRPNDKPIGTFAFYLHGAKGSIQEAFGGTVPTPGTAVPRGKVIMKVASSGDAKFNMLHVDVRPDNGSGKPDSYTIPFVFGDDDVKGDNGVPQSMRYYKSDNQKV